MRSASGIPYAIGAAILFGASTPIAKSLVGEIAPVMLAGLLYAGSGLGLAAALLIRRVATKGPIEPLVLPRGVDLGWLALAILFGGVLGPVLLMSGLATTPGSVSSLLLNLEAVFTAGLAWFVFREHFDRRIALGMALIVVAGVLLSWTPGDLALSPGALLVAGACLCWAIDNNFTRKVSAHDAMLIACVKGGVAGIFNLGVAAAIGIQLPSFPLVAVAAAVGFAGYGVSLTLFVLALRGLGAARTGAYFSVAPFFGAAIAVGLQHEPLTAALLVAAILMAWGVWLHISETHGHIHAHEPLEHSHAHVHDEHHRHDHDAAWNGAEPHTHRHLHRPIRHTHPHFPDIHHQHRH